MLRLRTEGIVAAAGASGFAFNDPNPGLVARGALISAESAVYPQLSALAQHNAYFASARLNEGGSANISWANDRFEEYISDLEADHPINDSGFAIFPWMATYVRWKSAGLDSSKFTRFRDIMLQWNTQGNMGPPLATAGHTLNQKWQKATAAVLIGEEWPGVDSGADNRYAYMRDTWLPGMGERFFKQGWHEYYSANYGLIYLTCFETLRRYSTNANIRNIALFMRDQMLISCAHIFALNQHAAADQRTDFSFHGTPGQSGFPQSLEHGLWLCFDGELPHMVWEGAPPNTQPGPEQAWEEFWTAMPIITSSTFEVPDIAWRINQAAHQLTHTLKERHQAEPQEFNQRPNHQWPLIETYTRANKKYAVSTSHWPNGMDVDSASSGGIHAGQRIHWIVTWASTGSRMSSFRVSQNDDESLMTESDWFFPISTHRSTCFGSDGVVVEVFNLPSGETNSFIEGFEPDQVQASSTSGNWRFLHMGTCMIACHFAAGFSIQSAKRPILHPDVPSFTRPWYRSPASGSATKLGLVVETAAPEDYPDGSAAAQLSNFAAAVTAPRGGFAGGVNDSQIGASQPQITYHALNGKTYVCEYMGVKSIDGVPFDWDNAKRLESPWVQQDYGGDDMFVTDPGTGHVIRYRWSDKSITLL